MSTPHYLASILLSVTLVSVQASAQVSDIIDLPKAVIELQSQVSAMGINTAPCNFSDPADAEPLICFDPEMALCGPQASNNGFERQYKVALFKLNFALEVQRRLELKLGKDPSIWLSDGIKKDDSEAVDARLLELSSMTNEISLNLFFELFKDEGWSKESVGKLIEKYKAIEISKAKSDDSIHPNQIKALSNAPWITPEALSKLPEKERGNAQRAMATTCGMHGLSTNAFAFIPSKTTADHISLSQALEQGSSAALMLCPGLMLKAALDGAGPESISFAVGHELGHIIEPGSQVKGTIKLDTPESQKKVADAEKAYERAVGEAETACPKLKGCFVRKDLFSEDVFLNSCNVDRVMSDCDGDSQSVRRKVAAIQSAAKDRQALVDRLTTPPGDTNRDRAYLSCLKKNDLNELNNGRKQIAAYKKEVAPKVQRSVAHRVIAWIQVQAMKQKIEDFEQSWGRKPDSIDLHQDELVADYWGTEVLDQQIKDAPNVAARRARLDANLKTFCDLAAWQSKENDYESHPAFGYRFQRILSNPGIRSSLGCKSPPPRVWCER